VHEQLPGGTSIYAREGTICHDIAAQYLTNGVPLESHIGYSEDYDEYQRIEIDESHVEAIEEYIDIVLGYQLKLQPCDLRVEQRVTAEHDMWGTADAILISEKHKVMHIFDLKMGRGVDVEADKNEQLALYAHSVIQQMNPIENIIPQNITVHIVQPRRKDRRIHSAWQITLEDLISFIDGQILTAREQILKGQEYTEFTPGEKQCRWCNYQPKCRAFAEWNLAKASITFSQFVDMNKQDLAETLGILDAKFKPLTLEERSKLKEWFPIFDIWKKNIEEDMLMEAIALHHKGQRIPGYKLGESVKHRKWRNEEEAKKVLMEILGDEESLYKKTMITPSQAEKAVGKDDKNKIAKFIYKPEGSPVLIPEDSNKPELNISAEAAFDSYKEKDDGSDAKKSS
jgi:hypothetical protein